MASKGTSGNSKGKRGPALSDQAHKQVIEYLRLAEKSSNPEIRAATLKIAEQTSKYQRDQGARVSPNLALAIAIVLGVATGGLCWYAFLYYPQLAYQLSGVAILLYLVIVAISLFLSELLSQGNLIKVFGWAVSHIKGWTSNVPKAGQENK
jgi:hypothetical protein